MKSAFDKIAAGLEAGIAYAEGDESRGRLIRPVDIKALRKAKGMTQGEFSRAFHLPLGTVRDWEQNRRAPESASKVYLSMIETDPEGVEKILNKMAAS